MIERLQREQDYIAQIWPQVCHSPFPLSNSDIPFLHFGIQQRRFGGRAVKLLVRGCERPARHQGRDSPALVRDAPALVRGREGGGDRFEI